MRALLLVVLCATPRIASPQEPAPDTEAPQVTDIDAVRVLGRRPADPFAFRNPVEAEGTVFDRHWDEPPSLEEIGMRGGYVQLGINKGLELAAKGIRKLPGWKGQVRAAEARPPPLDEAQLGRAARLQEAETGPPP